jgi:hypothetical protein
VEDGLTIDPSPRYSGERMGEGLARLMWHVEWVVRALLIHAGGKRQRRPGFFRHHD